jgi:SARP family transcriptional regulator, regulator of embCAB operon
MDWRDVGKTLEPLIRIYLAGQVGIECDGQLLSEWRSVGRQGRLAFAMLTAEHWRSVPRGELIEEIWPGDPPPSSDRALSAVVSKLRTLLERGGRPELEIAAAFGCYQMRLPANVWIDIEAAAEGIDQAEGFLRAEEFRAAWAPAQIACHIARRPFLQGDDGPWATRARTSLRDVSVRAYEALSGIYAWSGEPANAVRYAKLAAEAEPYRETTWQHLMRAHAVAGNRAEALRAYEQCRCLLAEDLGVSPSPHTEAVYLALLRS